MRDFESYWAAGRAQAAGLDPYGRAVWRYQRTIPGVVATRDEVLPFVGPPYGLPLWQTLAVLPFGSAIFVWGAVLAAAFATIALGSLALAGGPFDRLDVLATFALCAAFGPLTSGTGLGQVAILSTAAVVAGGLVARRSGVLLAASTFAAALQPNLALVLAATLSRRRFLPLALATVVALAVATAQPFGNLRTYLALLREHGDAERFIAIQTTLAAVLRGFGAGATASIAIGNVVAVAVVAIVVRQCLRRDRTLAERLAVACAAVPLAMPFSHEHDFTIAFVPAVVAVRNARGRTFALAALGTLALAVDWLGLAQRPTGVLESASLAVTAAFALAVLARAGDGPSPDGIGALARRSVAIVVAPLVVVAGALVHRLPTWPDALATTYRVPEAWTITQVWLDEQTRSGIAALDPGWAALRATSLLGSLLVWIAISRTRVARGDGLTEPEPRSSRSSTRPRSAAAVCPSSSRTP